MNIPLSYDNQQAEDDFRKRLLLLGAGWYDSEERHELLADFAKSDEEASLQLRNGEVPIAAKKERLWVGVGWPGGSTGLWVTRLYSFRSSSPYTPAPSRIWPSESGKKNRRKMSLH